MAGSNKTSAHEVLKRIEKLKAHIDKGKETSISKAVKKFIRSSHFGRALLKKDVVHVNKDRTLRWNGLAVNLTLAQAVVDDAHRTHKKYLNNFDKNEPNKRGKRGKYKRRSLNVPDDINREDEDLVATLGSEQLNRIAEKLKGDIYDEIKDMVKEVKGIFQATLQSIAAVSEKVDAVELISHRMRTDFETMAKCIEEVVNKT